MASQSIPVYLCPTPTLTHKRAYPSNVCQLITHSAILLILVTFWDDYSIRIGLYLRPKQIPKPQETPSPNRGEDNVYNKAETISATNAFIAVITIIRCKNIKTNVNNHSLQKTSAYFN